MSLRTDELKALKKGQKALMRCRREIGTAEFAAEQAGLKTAAGKLRSTTLGIAEKEETFEGWIRQARVERARKTG